jgi:cytochrome b subunit of formate dehydrogenase
MKKLYEVNIYASAEENSYAKRYKIPVHALNDKMAIMAVTVHLTAMGLCVKGENIIVAVYEPTTMRWYYL